MIRPYRGVMPRIAHSAYIDSSAQVIGDVVVGERSSVWLNVSIRGDVNYIRVGDESSIQDNTVLHVDRLLYPCIVGNRVTVGHRVVLHGCEVADDALIGIGAVVLNGAKIGAGAVVAAGALSPNACRSPPTCWSWAPQPNRAANLLPKNSSASAKTATTTSASPPSTRKSSLDPQRQRHARHLASL